MKCFKCGKDQYETVLYRVNPIGELPAVWACKEDSPTQPDTELVELSEIIHNIEKDMDIEGLKELASAEELEL